MLKRVLLSFLLAIVALVLVVAFQPADFQVSRSSIIAAPAAEIFPHVNDFRRWESWSPWAKLDPAMKVTYEGAATGEGAIYTWSGNSEVGQGKMTLLKSVPAQSIRIQLDFIKPMRAENITEFAFAPDGQGTRVTWTMSGRNNFVAKAFHMVMDVGRMVGADFEKGLASLKTTVESASSKKAAPTPAP